MQLKLDIIKVRETYKVIPLITEITTYANGKTSTTRFHREYIDPIKEKHPNRYISKSTLDNMVAGRKVSYKLDNIIEFLENYTKYKHGFHKTNDVMDAYCTLNGKQLKSIRESSKFPNENEFAKKLDVDRYIIKWMEKEKPVSRDILEKIRVFIQDKNNF